MSRKIVILEDETIGQMYERQLSGRGLDVALFDLPFFDDEDVPTAEFIVCDFNVIGGGDFAKSAARIIEKSMKQGIETKVIGNSSGGLEALKKGIGEYLKEVTDKPFDFYKKGKDSGKLSLAKLLEFMDIPQEDKEKKIFAK